MQRHFSQATFHPMAGAGEFAAMLPSNQRVFFEYYGSIEQIGWDEEELAFIEEYFPCLRHVYSLSYSGLEFIKQVLVHIADSPDFLVDNDCGTLLPGHEFMLKIKQEPNWHWFDDV
ncbi:hypothetical protein [Hymenobacter fodinae]|uniref:Uncharacterized protein n=1 Tax=Hymenobacter fodinae TaxID=2510796 RepID=A0A4Z0P1Q3_9BACT|nr:hypothetical protein [Hymenobacter fodinae]TGE04851.1 hypothetical protein EU556_21985 [Hymenobacter fodinae]